jgi:hypothetical protein
MTCLTRRLTVTRRALPRRTFCRLTSAESHHQTEVEIVAKIARIPPANVSNDLTRQAQTERTT